MFKVTCNYILTIILINRINNTRKEINQSNHKLLFAFHI